MPTIRCKTLSNLDCQLSRGGQYESEWVIGYRLAVLFSESVQNRQSKGSGLSGPRLRTAQYIAPGEGGWNGLRLNGCWSCVFLISQCRCKGTIKSSWSNVLKGLPSYIGSANLGLSRSNNGACFSYNGVGGNHSVIVTFTQDSSA